MGGERAHHPSRKIQRLHKPIATQNYLLFYAIYAIALKVKCLDKKRTKIRLFAALVKLLLELGCILITLSQNLSLQFVKVA